MNWPNLGVLLLFMLAHACGRVSPRHGADATGAVLTGLDPKLAPLAQSRDSMVRAIHADSGTARADSTFIQFRKSFGAAVAAAVKTFNSPSFEALVVNSGWHADMPSDHRRLDGLPTDSASVMADSIVAYLNAFGIWTERSEGLAAFDMSETALLRSVGSFLTPPSQAFLRLAAHEQDHPSAEDASLMISWDQLGDLVARTERISTLHPIAPVRDLVAERYNWYLRFYLFGADNSEVFQRQSREIDPRVRESYERYVAKYRSTASGRLIEGYLDALRANDYRYGAPVAAFVRAHTSLPDRVIRPR